jgi:hypothetical protein
MNSFLDRNPLPGSFLHNPGVLTLGSALVVFGLMVAFRGQYKGQRLSRLPLVGELPAVPVAVMLLLVLENILSNNVGPNKVVALLVFVVTFLVAYCGWNDTVVGWEKSFQAGQALVGIILLMVCGGLLAQAELATSLLMTLTPWFWAAMLIVGVAFVFLFFKDGERQAAG